MSILLDQQELCESVIGPNVLIDLGFADASQDVIQDFTVVGFQFLVCLFSSSKLVVFDCESLLSGASPQVRYMMTITLDCKEFGRLEALDDGIPRSVLVIGRQA